MQIEDIVRQLKERGFRHTVLREALLKELLALPHGATAPQLLLQLEQEGQRVNKTTLYRQLEMLTQEGFLQTLPGIEGAVTYELVGEHHHHHVRCMRCQKVEGIAMDSVEKELAKVQRSLARKGYASLTHVLELTGLCSYCR